MRRGSSTDSHFPFVFQLRVAANLLSAASSSVYGILLQASQASDVGSHTIAQEMIEVESGANGGHCLSDCQGGS